MVPLRDDNPTQITPYVTYGLILLNILVFSMKLAYLHPHWKHFSRMGGRS
ncbi:MAG: rhomboid family intramembrane serine protease, partial [Leptolyngbyaceae cyanobacterium RM2_2_4]|nr:rhomboid family intramembrane serine protease [Leptolyngbyaceae cyanobacterium RM2_2_4]